MSENLRKTTGALFVRVQASFSAGHVFLELLFSFAEFDIMYPKYEILHLFAFSVKLFACEQAKGSCRKFFLVYSFSCDRVFPAPTLYNSSQKSQVYNIWHACRCPNMI